MTSSADLGTTGHSDKPSYHLLSILLSLCHRLHWLPLLLCCLSLWAQMTYRVPGQALFIILPLVNAALTAWTFVWWAGVFVLKLPPAGSFQRPLLQVWTVMSGIILLFTGYGAVLFVNGRWDPSPLEPHASIVKDVRGVDSDIEYLLPPWIEIEAWSGSGTVRLPLKPRERDQFWAAQPVLVHLRSGALGIPWVARLERDRERQARQILKSVPTAGWAWKHLVNFYIDAGRWDEAKATLLEYLKLYPHDYEFAKGSSVSFILTHHSAEAVEIMEPFLATRPSYELYNLLGFEYHKLGKRDKAVQLLQTSLGLDAESYDAYYHLGYVYRAMGKPREAAAMFEEVLKRRNIPEVAAQLDAMRKAAASQL